jgi:hypothetical protein
MDDRRAVDLGPPPSVFERRRKPGRPRLPIEKKPQTRHVKLPAAVDDALCRAAVRMDLKVNRFIRLAIERALAVGL